MTLPPAQNDALPDGVIVGVNAPMVTLALPVDEQLLRVAVTLIETGLTVPTEKVIDDVPWPVCSVPLVTDQVYVAPPTGLVMLAPAVLFGQTDAGALMAADLAIARPKQIRRVVMVSVPVLNDVERDAFRRGPWRAAQFDQRHQMRRIDGVTDQATRPARQHFGEAGCDDRRRR